MQHSHMVSHLEKLRVHPVFALLGFEAAKDEGHSQQG